MHPSDARPSARPDGELILRVADVGKAFRRFEHQPFLLRNLLQRAIGRGKATHSDMWPLRHISFDIHRGETVGIVGHNGCGKSTLLRLIAGAAYPSEGLISVRGRIAPLLALGAGFQPDMTGRECIEINATALGLTREEIVAQLPEIVAFAELAEFIGTPVRYYSSGMLARLGFSVAVHTRPDLLLVDEVLAVGDQAFQDKCLARIRELRDGGTTILFVSHAAEQVRHLCERALWLHGGALVADGPAAEVLEAYGRDGR